MNKLFLSVEMFLGYYFSFLVVKWPASLGLIYFLIITCEVAAAFSLSDVKM